MEERIGTKTRHSHTGREMKSTADGHSNQDSQNTLNGELVFPVSHLTKSAQPTKSLS